MVTHIANALTIDDVENKIYSIANVLSCGLVGFNTPTPSVRVFFAPNLNKDEKYEILKKILKLMEDYGLGSSEETRWCNVGFEILYKRNR